MGTELLNIHSTVVYCTCELWTRNCHASTTYELANIQFCVTSKQNGTVGKRGTFGPGTVGHLA
jgi:hypothetical protein